MFHKTNSDKHKSYGGLLGPQFFSCQEAHSASLRISGLGTRFSRVSGPEWGKAWIWLWIRGFWDLGWWPGLRLPEQGPPEGMQAEIWEHGVVATVLSSAPCSLLGSGLTGPVRRCFLCWGAHTRLLEGNQRPRGSLSPEGKLQPQSDMRLGTFWRSEGSQGSHRKSAGLFLWLSRNKFYPSGRVLGKWQGTRRSEATLVLGDIPVGPSRCGSRWVIFDDTVTKP